MNEEKSLYDVISEFEGASVIIENSLYLLQVYEEFLDNEVEGIDAKNPYTVSPFLSRYDLVKSQTFGIFILLRKALDQMTIATKAGLDICKTIKEAKKV